MKSHEPRGWAPTAREIAWMRRGDPPEQDDPPDLYCPHCGHLRYSRAPGVWLPMGCPCDTPGYTDANDDW